jgi:hypothetical protein
MAVDIKFLIDGTDRGQPIDAENFSVNVSEDKNINARIVSFDNDLTFVGGVYEYLFNNLVETGGCSLINVDVQYMCAGVWKRLVTGFIIVSECNFLLDKCQVKTKLYDNSFSSKINNNKSIPFPLNSIITKNLQTVVPPVQRKIRLYNPANGTYQYYCYGVGVYDAFKHLVSCMSDNLVDFDSNYFAFDFSADGNFNLVTTGLSIINETTDPAIVSFQDLYTALNKKLRLGMAIETQANGRPLLRIEPADYFNQQGAQVNLYDQPNISVKFDTAQQFASIDFGSSPYLEQHECNNGATACTFFQDSFRGFKEETFGLLGECNTTNTLSLNSDKIVFDTNVIEDTYVHSNENYNNNTFVIQSFWDVSANQGNARKFDPYNINQDVYNGDFTNSATALNWVGGYPNGIYSYIQGFTPGSTQVQARSNASPLQNWLLSGDCPAFGCFTPKYSGGSTTYVAFANEIIDPGNNFDGTKYIIPYTAEYTFTATVIGDGRADYGYYSMIVRSNGIGGVIDSYSDFIPVLPHGLFFDAAVTTVTWTTICNQGDVVTVNIFGGSDVTGPNAQVLNSWLDVETDITYYTQFDAIGTPFPEVLQPVDPNSIKRFVYSFERPLRMQEIEAILDNTSRPIKFGQFDDPLRVIEGYINKVDIKSIIKQDASIQLKSNKILR